MARRDDFDDERTGGVIAALYGILQRRDSVAPRGLRVWLPVAAMVAVFAAVLWYSYPREEARRELLAVPVIKADLSSYKTIPADRGGMDIPHQDSTVFQAIRESGAGGEGVENLLPEAEQPLPRAQLFAGLKTELAEEKAAAAPVPAPDRDAEDIQAAAKPAPEAAVEARPAEVKPLEVKPDDAKLASSSPGPAAKPAAKPSPDKAPALAATEPAAGTPGDYYVQLGSLRSQDDARKAWKDLQSGFPAQLGSLSLRVQSADLGGKGTYYRVQGGPVAEARAKEICQAVTKQKPGGCLVVRR